MNTKPKKEEKKVAEDGMPWVARSFGNFSIDMFDDTDDDNRWLASPSVDSVYAHDRTEIGALRKLLSMLDALRDEIAGVLENEDKEDS